MMAPLAAAYPEVPPCPVTATFEVMLTMEPFERFRKGKAACEMV